MEFSIQNFFDMDFFIRFTFSTLIGFLIYIFARINFWCKKITKHCSPVRDWFYAACMAAESQGANKLPLLMEETNSTAFSILLGFVP